jgi:hypothetical protein
MFTAEGLAAEALRVNGDDPKRAAVWALNAVLEELPDLSEADVTLSLESVVKVLES